MPVPLPRVCAVLAHELRSPLSVIQGYIRLLQRQRDADHPDTAVLEAMLQSTARLTAIARQASDLGLWLTALETTPLLTVSLGDVVDALTERAQNTASVRIAALDIAPARIKAEPRALADAVIALAESMARETGETEIEVSISASTADAATRFVLRPRTYAGPPVSPPSRTAAERAVTFDRGGAGLGLVFASYVLDAHGATVTPDESGHISLQFPPERGAQ
jgi:light-regulated signal transduction histidine kinase (bacteriophytochrome)